MIERLYNKMDMTYRFYPFGTRNPFLREVISHEDGTLVFDGYFYVDQKDLPVERVMVRFGESLTDVDGNNYRTATSAAHIEIYEKISGEDTSFYGDPKETDVSGNTVDDNDSDEGICFFPTEITTLKYRVLKSELSKIERDMVLETIKEKEKLREDAKFKELTAGMDLLE